MTDAERQAKQRDREKERRALARDVIAFIRWTTPAMEAALSDDARAELYRLQSRIRVLHSI